MGWKVTPEILKLMSSEDQAKYGPGLHPADDPHPPVKTDALERDEQRQFASWCMLNDLPFVWHSTAHPTKATVGCPDFIIGTNPALWIEFKRVQASLSPDQEKFRVRLERQGVQLFICYSAAEAIELCRPYAVLNP